MNRPLIASVAVGLGICCLVLSHFWPEFARSQTTWDEPKAAQRAERSHRLHELSYGPSHSHGGSRPRRPTAEDQAHHEQELAEARRQYEASTQELIQEQNAGLLVAQVLWVLGLLAVAGGVGFYYTTGQGS